MASSSTILEVNRELARKINEETRADPHSPYANKFVGIVDDKVVVIADDLDELGRRLRGIELRRSEPIRPAKRTNRFPQ